MKKWSLIIFTILSQMAVGAFWVLMAVQRYFSARLGGSKPEDLIVFPLLITVAIMLLSLPVSLAHLGSPLIAFRAISNFRSSWLSREIIFALLFALSSGTYTYALWGQFGSAALRLAVAGLAMVFAFMLIYSMSRLYMLRTVPVWNTLFTPLSFYLTAVTLGGLMVGVILTIKGYSLDASINNDILTVVTIGSLFILGCELLIIIIGRIVTYFFGSSKVKEHVHNLLDGYGGIFYLRLFFIISGFVCLVIMLFQAFFTLSRSKELCPGA